MQINKKIATEVMPSSLVAIVILLLMARTVTGIYERLNPEKFQSQDLVQWRDAEHGLAESRASGKPMFIYFSGAAYIHNDEEYRRNYFGDQKIANDINSKYIPVKVWDKTLGDKPKDKTVIQMQEKFLQWYSQPAIHVVPVECQLVHNERYRLPHFYLFGQFNSRNAMFSFIDEYANWHPIPVSPSSDVKWARMEEAQKLSKFENKPVLYFFARHNDKECNEAMKELFEDYKCEQNQLNKYVCCMVYDHTPSGNKNCEMTDKLIKKYSIQSFPTFVIDKTAIFGQNDKVIGFRGHDSMEEFLTLNATNLKESAGHR